MPKFTGEHVFVGDQAKIFEILVAPSLKEFGVEMTDEEIVGVKHVKPYKTSRMTIDTEVEIMAFERNQKYCIETRMHDMRYIVQVELVPLDDGQVKVIYTEWVLSTKKFKNFSLKLYSRFVKKQMQAKIEAIFAEVENQLKLE